VIQAAGEGRRTILFGALAITAALLFSRLGIWQLDRLAERRHANAEIRRLLAEPAVRLAAGDVADSAALVRLAWRRAETAGRYDPGREVVVRGRTWQGTPGVELLTPLELEDGGTLWVNRGWLPSPDAEHVDAARYAEPGTVRVRGILRPAGKGEAPRVGRPPGAVLQQLPDRSLPGPPYRREEPELTEGPHLSYAVQWFAFAATAIAGFGTYVWSRRGGRR
jgi:surfeit locus 1 family protein